MTEALGKDTDAGVLEMPGAEYRAATKAIRMGPPMKMQPISVISGDQLQITVKDKFVSTHKINRAFNVDTVIPIEVIDDFGLDVGVGCLIGQAKVNYR